MKNKDIMGKVIKITEEELHDIIKTKIQTEGSKIGIWMRMWMLKNLTK